MVHAYWHIGGQIESHLAAESRSGAYGKNLLDQLSARLRQDFGTGFDPTKLINMRRFFQTFEIPDAPRQESQASTLSTRSLMAAHKQSTKPAKQSVPLRFERTLALHQWVLASFVVLI